MQIGSFLAQNQRIAMYSIILLIFIMMCFLPVVDVRKHHETKSKEVLNDLFDDVVDPGTEFIPNSTLQLWRRTDFLIVLGIPSEDIPARRSRRELQRKTCWTYDGVATRANDYMGDMLVVYALGRSPTNNFEYSSELKEEANLWHDIIVLPMNEGIKTTMKRIGDDGFWGIDAEIGMSRKAFFWLYTANKLFPRATYIAKGDDDIFMRVPMYLATLRTLPKKGLYWGYGASVDHKRVGFPTANIFYAYGMCMTLAMDLVEQFLAYEPVHQLVYTPYNESLKSDFLSLRMDHEDVMIGIVLHNTGYSGIVYAADASCHLHNVHTGGPVDQVTSDSIVVHHLKEEDYGTFMNIFGNITSPHAVQTFRRGNKITFLCRRGLPTLFPYR